MPLTILIHESLHIDFWIAAHVGDRVGFTWFILTDRASTPLAQHSGLPVREDELVRARTHRTYSGQRHLDLNCISSLIRLFFSVPNPQRSNLPDSFYTPGMLCISIHNRKWRLWHSSGRQRCCYYRSASKTSGSPVVPEPLCSILIAIHMLKAFGKPLSSGIIKSLHMMCRKESIEGGSTLWLPPFRPPSFSEFL